MDTDTTPPSGRRGGYRTLSILAGLALVFSVLVAFATTRAGLSFAHEVTCGGEPPVAWRQSVTYLGLGIYAVCALGSLGLLLQGKRTGVIFSLLLAVSGSGVSVIACLIPVLASALC